MEKGTQLYLRLSKPQLPEDREQRAPVTSQSHPVPLLAPTQGFGAVSYQPLRIKWSQLIAVLVRGGFWGWNGVLGGCSADPELWEFLQCVLALLLTALLLLSVFSSPDMFDKTRSGRIDVYGFSALLRFIQQWKNLFQQYDRDQSGSISFSELQQGG